MDSVCTQRPWRHLWWAVPVLLLLWMRVFEFPIETSTPQLDDSWRAVKGWELLHHPRVGVESVFTYGPLGWFHSSTYVPGLYGWKLYAWEVGFRLLLCGLCVLAVVRTPGWTARLWFVVVLLWASSTLDAFAFLVLAAQFRWLLDEPKRDWRAECAVLLLGTLLADTKFTYFVLHAAGVLVCAAALWLESGRGRALGLLLRAAGVFAACWIALGQSLLDLPRYVQTSNWIASGYNDGMATPGSTYEVVVAGGLLALIFGLVCASCWRSPRDRRVWAMGAIVLLASFASFKAGFTRHMTNSTVFFTDAPILPLFLLVRPPRASRFEPALVWLRRAALGLLLLLSTLGYQEAIHERQEGLLHYFDKIERDFSNRADELRGLDGRLARLEEGHRLTRRRFRMPFTAGIVGQETLDVFGVAQGIALLNDFNFRPRPVFQTYSVYTPELLRLNRDFYTGPRAPRYVLYSMSSIDMRLPTQDDCLAFEALLLNYKPVGRERNFLLLEREPTPRPAPTRETLLERELPFDEWLPLADLPGETLRLEVEAVRSAAGKLHALLLGGSRLFADFEREDGSVQRYRILPAIAGVGLLVRPGVEFDPQAQELFWGAAAPGFKRVRFSAARGERFLWRPLVGVRVVRCEGLLPPRREPPPKAPLQPFDPAPNFVGPDPQISPVEHRGRLVALCGAPSTLGWDVRPGRHALATDYGVLDEPGSARQGAGGVYFRVALSVEGEVPRTLFERRLDPQQVPDEREVQSLELEFETEKPARLLLRTEARGSSDPCVGHAFWGPLKLRRR